MPAETEIEKEMESGEGVNFSDFLKLGGGERSEGAGAQGETKEVPKETIKEEPTEEVITEEVTEEKVELKEETDDTEQREPLPGVEVKEPEPAKVKVPRDYTGIDDSHKPMFEKMGNEAFKLAKEKYIEAKTLKAENETLKKQPKGASVYGHERAYVLTPEHDALVTNVQKAEFVQKHWAVQAARIKRGEPFEDLNEDAQGRFVKSPPREATADDEANVAEWLEMATQQKLEQKSKYQAFVGSYAQNYKGDLERLNTGIAQFFPESTKPELKKMEETVINKWIPPSFREHPVARLWAHTVYELAKAQEKIKALEKTNGKQEIIKKQAKDAPPTKAAMGAGAGATSTVPKFSDFLNRKNQE